MTKQAHGNPQELAAIAVDYPGWRPWQSKAGRWWATRLGVRHIPDGVPPEWAMTVDADSSVELRRELASQEALPPRRLTM